MQIVIICPGPAPSQIISPEPMGLCGHWTVGTLGGLRIAYEMGCPSDGLGAIFAGGASR